MEPSKFTGDERRKHPRVRVNLTVFYKVDQPVAVRLVIGGKEIEAVMSNLSENGMALLTHYKLGVGTPLLIRFTLFTIEKDVSFYGPVEIKADVRHCEQLLEKFNVGVNFAEISQKDKDAITAFIGRVKA